MEQLKSLREEVAAMEQELAQKEAEDPEAETTEAADASAWRNPLSSFAREGSSRVRKVADLSDAVSRSVEKEQELACITGAPSWNNNMIANDADITLVTQLKRSANEGLAKRTTLGRGFTERDTETNAETSTSEPEERESASSASQEEMSASEDTSEDEAQETEMGCSVEEVCKVNQGQPGSSHVVKPNSSASHRVDLDRDKANQLLHLAGAMNPLLAEVEQRKKESSRAPLDRPQERSRAPLDRPPTLSSTTPRTNMSESNGGEALPLSLQQGAGGGGRSKGGEGPFPTTKGGGHDSYRKERGIDFNSRTRLLKPLQRLRDQTCIIDVSTHPALEIRADRSGEAISRAESFSRAQSGQSVSRHSRVESVDSRRSDSSAPASAPQQRRDKFLGSRRLAKAVGMSSGRGGGGGGSMKMNYDEIEEIQFSSNVPSSKVGVGGGGAGGHALEVKGDSRRTSVRSSSEFSTDIKAQQRNSFFKRVLQQEKEKVAEGSFGDASPRGVSLSERTIESKVQFSSGFDLEAQQTKRNSFLLRRHKGGGRSTTQSKSSVNSEGTTENDDDDGETSSKVSGTAKVYLNVLAVVGLVLTDLIFLIVFEIVWFESTCSLMEYPSGGVEHSSRWEVVTVKLLITFMYLAKIYSIYAKLRRTRAGFNLYSFCSNGHQDLLLLLIIVLGCFLLIFLEIYECEATEATFFEDPSVQQLQRVKVAMHLLRVIVACKALLLRLKKTFRRKLQTAVSQNRRRFRDPDGDFDLDLTYICDRLIAMSLPCVGGAFYRNDMRDVARFFANFHYGSFTVVNCCEAQEESGNGNYDPLFLYMQVKKFPMRDHNICSLRTIVVYCEFAVMFLNKSPDKVIAVHCQGGKGRTGSFCSSLMLWSGLFSNAGEALGYFCRRRTDNSRGTNHSPIAVTSPSQRRYVHYLEEVIKLRTDYISPKYMILEELTITGQPHESKDCCNFTFVIENGSTVEYDHGKAKGLISCMASNSRRAVWTIKTAIPVLISRDVSIRFYYFDATVPLLATVGATAQISAGGRNITYGSLSGKQLMFVQFHTAFCKAETMDFSKKDLDGVYNKSSSLFAEDFMLTVHLDMCLNKYEHINAKADETTSSADSIRQHELFLLRPRAHQVANTDDQVLRIMRRLCPETKTFKRGDAIYNPAYHARSRVLYYVENGNVLLQPKTDTVRAKENPDNGSRWCHDGTTSVGPDIVWGCGQFISLTNFLLGLDTFWGDGSATVAYAYSETVTMRIWVMPEETDAPVSSSILRQSNQPRKKQKSKSKHQHLAPLRMVGEEAHDIDILYEAICFQIMTLSQAADNIAVRSMQQTVKYGQNDGFRIADVVRQARLSLGIPITEPCKFSAEGLLLPAAHLKQAVDSMKRKQKYVWPITDDSSEKNRTYVLVFLSIIVVTDCCGRPISEVLGNPLSVKIPDISNVNLDSNVVKILIGTSKSDCSPVLSFSDGPSTNTLPRRPEPPSTFRSMSPLPNVSASSITTFAGSMRNISPLRNFLWNSSMRNVSPLSRGIDGNISPESRSPARSRRYSVQNASDYTDAHVAQIKYQKPSTKIQSSFDSESDIELQSAGPQRRTGVRLDRVVSSGSSRWAPPRRGAGRGALVEEVGDEREEGGGAQGEESRVQQRGSEEMKHQISGEGFGNSGEPAVRDEEYDGHAPLGGSQHRNGMESEKDQGAHTPSVVKCVSTRSISWGEPETNGVKAKSYLSDFGRDPWILRLCLIRAQHLPKMDLIGTADPYVTFHLLGQDQQKSSVIKNTLDPEWNEEFVFYMHDLSFYQNDNQLVLNIWDWDRISKNEVIGEVRLMISDLLGAYGTNICKTVNIMKKGSTEHVMGHDSEKSTVTLLFSASNVSFSASNVADDIAMAVGNCATAMQATEDSAKGFMGFLQKGVKRKVSANRPLNDSAHNDQAPKPQEEPLALLFRDHYVAIEASCEIHKLISTEAFNSKKKFLSCDVHPVAVMLGLVDIDGETGNLQESLEEKEVMWLREFLEHVPSITCAKGLVVVEAGNLNKCIYGVISGSLSVQDKDGVVVRRVSPGGFLGHWSYFNTGNRGASFSVVADDEGTVVFEFSRHLMDKIRAKWPQINARFNRIQATEICKRYVHTETNLSR